MFFNRYSVKNVEVYDDGVDCVTFLQEHYDRVLQTTSWYIVISSSYETRLMEFVSYGEAKKAFDALS